MDLFGDTVTTPQFTDSGKSLINRAHGFVEFWKAWPSGDRKVAKQQCLDKWARYSCCDSSSHIVAHVEYLKTTDQWQKGIIPAPLVYLNQQRWIDWEPPKEKKKDTWTEDFEEHLKKAVPMPEHLKKRLMI